MLALSKNLANCYDKKPYLIARSTTDDTELYFVDEQSLPAQGCDGAPLDLLDKREIHSIRSKWKVGKRTFSKIRRALKEQKEEFDLTSDEENEENVRCCIEDIENGVLNKLKREVRVSSITIWETAQSKFYTAHLLGLRVQANRSSVVRY